MILYYIKPFCHSTCGRHAHWLRSTASPRASSDSTPLPARRWEVERQHRVRPPAPQTQVTIVTLWLKEDVERKFQLQVVLHVSVFCTFCILYDVVPIG